MSNKEYLDLKQELIKAGESYYYAQPLMSDATYDEKYRELQAIEHKHPEWITSDSPTQVAGASIKISKGFKKAKHSHPMLSLKTETDFTEQGAVAFDKRVKEELGVDYVEYYAEPKFDGLGLDLKYINGALVQALTRGDGEIGEDVTANAMAIDDIPKHLQPFDGRIPKLLITRGEVLMFKDVFAELNKQKLLNGEKEYANTRNAAAGAIRQLDPNKTKERKLNFIAYSLVEIKGLCEDLTKHSQQQNLLHLFGFKLSDSDWHIWHDHRGYSHNLLEYHPHIKSIRSVLPYDIDGVVYKVNDLELQKKLGFSGREPKWAVAHKFPAEVKETKLLAIDIQVGRTGKLTPVARLQPVAVGGVIVTNVTLHNESEIQRKDVRVGDIVLVRRAGDVIPEIIGPFDAMANQERSPLFKMPSHCPVCGSLTHKEADEADYRCTGGMYCIAQTKASIAHFTQRKAVEISGLGDSIIEQLVDKNIVKNIVDVYTLGMRELAEKLNIPFNDFIVNLDPIKRKQLAISVLMRLDKMALKSATNLVHAINVSKKTTLRKFIYGLGIRHVGEGTAKRLVNNLGQLDEIMYADMNKLMSIEDIGPIAAESIFNFFKEENNRKIISDLIFAGITWSVNESSIKSTDGVSPRLYSGMNIVITGTLHSMTRDKAQSVLELLGANVTNSVSKDTDVLIAGPGAGSKLNKAQSLGIKIIDEQTFTDSLKGLTFGHF